MASGSSQSDTPTDALSWTVEKAIEIYQKALDDLVGVNSLFTTAVFIGISMESSLAGKKECNVDAIVTKRLLVFEVVAFGCYLLSSLVAKALKIHLSTYLILKFNPLQRPGRKAVISFLMFLSTWGSIFGCLFLTLSMVNIIRIRLGKISCTGSLTLQTSATLIATVTLALVLYISFMMRAIYVSFFHEW